MIDRVLAAIRTRPGLNDLLDMLLALIVFALIGALISMQTGLARWAPLPGAQVLLLALRSIFIPALGEEIEFRAMLVPGRRENSQAAFWIAGSTLLFVLWHVLETTFLPGAAKMFLRADFLVLAGVLGLICAILRYRSGSVWTAVAFHWIVVVAWQGWFGGASALSMSS